MVLDHFSKFQTHPNKIEGSTPLVTVKEKVQWAVKIALKVKTLLCYIGSGLFDKKISVSNGIMIMAFKKSLSFHDTYWKKKSVSLSYSHTICV